MVEVTSEAMVVAVAISSRGPDLMHQHEWVMVTAGEEFVLDLECVHFHMSKHHHFFFETYGSGVVRPLGDISTRLVLFRDRKDSQFRKWFLQAVLPFSFCSSL